MNFLWRIEMFGGLCLRGGGEGDDRAAVVERFQTRKTASLLAYLAYHRGRIVTRDVLADQFWPDADPADARNSLRVAIASLRRQLEPPGVLSQSVLITDRNTVTLRAAAFASDVADFEEAIKAEQRLENNADAAPTVEDERVSHLMRAVELYRGPLLFGSYDDWVADEQARLAASFATVLRRLVRLLIARRDNDRALVYARQVTTLDPLDEEAHRTLIRLHMAQGRLDDARAQWRALETVLREQLGVAPSQASRAMAEQLRLNVALSPTPTTDEDKGDKIQGNIRQAPLAEAPSVVLSPPLSLLPPSSPFPAYGGNSGGIPIPFTRLWGREAELNALTPVLRPVSNADAKEAAQSALQGDALFAAGDPRTRLVTLTGPGGTGKTRLAAELGARLQPAYRNRVWFAPLASVTDPQLLGRALADVLRVPPPPPGSSVSPLDAIVEALGGDADDGAPALLIFDNAEQIAPSVARIVRVLLARVPRLVCLITSRQRLDLGGEYEFALAPLPLPDENESADPEALSRYASVRLFVDRAQALRPDFQITARSANAIAHLCRRLDGLPLALELAAAWARLLTPAQMLERLEQAGDALLTSDRRGMPERHRSLRAVMDESYQLLSEPAQQAFAALSVFRGGWTARAAAAVMGASVNRDGSGGGALSDDDDAAEVPRNDTETLEWMRVLNQHSLVRMDEDKGSDDLRFSLLETLREYAATKLTGETLCLRADAHARYFVRLARFGGAGLISLWADECLAELDREQDNLRAALAWTLRSAAPPRDAEVKTEPRVSDATADQSDKANASNEYCAPDAEKGLRLAAAMWRFWYVRGQGDEGMRWLGRALLAVPPPPHEEAATTSALALRGEALLGAGRLAGRHGDLLEACGFLENALVLFRTAGDDAKVTIAAMNLGSAARDRGDAPLAQTALAGALEASRRAFPFDLWTLAALLTEAGEAALAAGGATAQALLREDADLRDLLGDRWGAAEARILLAQALEREENASAKNEASLLRSAGEAVMDTLGDDHGIAASFLRLGYIAQAQGDLPAARGLFVESLSAFQTTPTVADGGDAGGAVLAQTALGMCAWRQNDTGAARDAFAAALRLRRDERENHGKNRRAAPVALALLPVALLAAAAPATRTTARSALRECLTLCDNAGNDNALNQIAFWALRLLERVEREAGRDDVAARAARAQRFAESGSGEWRDLVTAETWTAL